MFARPAPLYTGIRLCAIYLARSPESLTRVHSSINPSHVCVVADKMSAFIMQSTAPSVSSPFILRHQKPCVQRKAWRALMQNVLASGTSARVGSDYLHASMLPSMGLGPLGGMFVCHAACVLL